MDNRQAVMVIDDDVMSLNMIGEFLNGEYIVSCVKSGDEAFSLLRGGFFPDIILLDIDMPLLDGFDTLSLLRDIDGAQQIPVVFLTGITRDEAQLRGLSLGAVDYVTKPFVKEILLARIRVHIDTGRKLRQLSDLEKDSQHLRIDEHKLDQFSQDMTDTEKKVLRLIALGFSNHEIGETLHYSYNYIKKVVAVIYEKKGVRKRSELKRMLQ